MNFGPILCVVFLGIWSFSIFAASESLVTLLVSNAVVQAVFFLFVAVIPFLRTGRMSFVDIAWPFGVALIGVQILVFGEGNTLRGVCVAGVYLLIGLRMGVGAVTMAKTTGVIFRTEFPRYAYRRMTLAGESEGRKRFHMLAEIMAQGFANMSVLALPGFMMAVNAGSTVSGWEIAGICLWLVAYVLESTADVQKMRFISNNKGGVCNIGLWRYSRHPNYFAEWLVWTGLVTASIPSWLALQSTESLPVWMTLGVGAAGASAMMYITLVYLTGAIPAEYYSVRKRPEYRRYQETTNRFFPGVPRA